jgi:hypothetical protein
VGHRYRILADGINYPDGEGGEKRAEHDEIVEDLPKKSVPWLLEQGHIEEAKADKSDPRETATGTVAEDASDGEVEAT